MNIETDLNDNKPDITSTVCYSAVHQLEANALTIAIAINSTYNTER